MAYETIYHPNVIKMNVNYGAGIDVSLGGSIPKLANAAFTFVLYGDLFFFVAIDNVGITYRAMLRVKSNGQFCWYADQPTPQNIAWNGTYANVNQYAPILNGDVLTSQTLADIRTMIIPNHFINGGWIYVPSVSKSLPAPCGITPQDSNIVLSANDLALVEYTNAHGPTYDMWAATGNYVNGNFNIVNGGFVGTYPNGVDPIFQNSDLNKINGLFYGVGDGCVSYTPFGMHGTDVSFKDMVGNFDAFFNASVIQGGLNCVGSGRPLPSASIQFFRILDRNAPEFAGTSFRIHYQSGWTSAIDIANIFAIGNLYNEVVLFDGTNFVTVNPTVGVGYTGNMGVVNNTAILVQANTAPMIYLSHPLNLPPMGPPPNVQSNLSSLLNWHRPISTRGLFRT